MNKKKYIKFILFASVPFLLILVLFFLLSNNEKSKEYDYTEISLDSFGQSDLDVDISSISDDTYDNYPAYYILQKSQVDNIEEMIDKTSLLLDRKVGYEEMITEWEGAGSSFLYESLTDILVFQFGRSQPFQYSDTAFEDFFSEFLGREYQFNNIGKEIGPNRETSYFASRVVEDLNLELGYGHGFDYTDMLKFDRSGYLIGGRIFLSEIERKDEYLSIVSKDELSKYINAESYPKESYIKTFELFDTLDLDYLDHEWVTIAESASNCRANNSELIYLYKTKGQEYLYPTFKMNSTCEVVHEDEIYSVPAIIYVNAVSPEYVIVD